MKFIKIVLAYLILSSSANLEAQTVSTDCETAAPFAPKRPENCQAFDIANCWAFGSVRAYNNYYPAAGKETLMYEDLWPAMGDFDFNDYVCSYRYNLVTNASNKVVEMKLNLTSRAIGASNKNGFAFQLDALDPAKVTAVNGTQTNSADWVSNAENGTENGQEYVNILVFDDALKTLPSLGGKKLIS
jgi:hypothetical protein